MTKQEYLELLEDRLKKYDELSLQMDDIMKQLQKLHHNTRLQVYLLKRELRSMREFIEESEGGNRDD